MHALAGHIVAVLKVFLAALVAAPETISPRFRRVLLIAAQASLMILFVFKYSLRLSTDYYNAVACAFYRPPFIDRCLGWRLFHFPQKFAVTGGQCIK